MHIHFIQKNTVFKNQMKLKASHYVKCFSAKGFMEFVCVILINGRKVLDTPSYILQWISCLKKLSVIQMRYNLFAIVLSIMLFEIIFNYCQSNTKMGRFKESLSCKKYSLQKENAF